MSAGEKAPNFDTEFDSDDGLDKWEDQCIYSEINWDSNGTYQFSFRECSNVWARGGVRVNSACVENRLRHYIL